MAVDLSLVAAGLAGLAAVSAAFGVLPAIGRRRLLLARLHSFAGPIRADATPERVSARERAAHLAIVWRRVEPSWLVGREVLLAALAITGIAAQALTHDPILVVAALVQVLVFSTLWGQDLLATRRRLFDQQTLPTMLRLAAALRAGASLLQAIESVARDAPSPTREECGRVLDEVALGTPLDAALDRLVERIGTSDYQALAVVLSVQRRVGGNLALVLDSLAETVRERIELRRQVDTLTAQQRFSTWILVLLPFLIAGVFWLADRSFMEPLVTTTAGKLMVLGGSLMLAVGSWALRWAGRVDL